VVRREQVIREYPLDAARGIAGALTVAVLLIHPAATQKKERPAPVRNEVLARAQLWRPTNVPAIDVKAGPQGKGAFPFRATVRCEYLEEELGGSSPKFLCAMGKTLEDDFKVKFGAANGEVYGEVLATRLLWTLGFGADRMYPVIVDCIGCPKELGGDERPGGERRFDPAVIERRTQGWQWRDQGERGWEWTELKLIDPAAGGATIAQRDAYTLLAVFMQHSDSKPEQQRILCLGTPPRSSKVRCNQPFLMISDLGLTFGKSSGRNANAVASVNLANWKATPIWKQQKGKKPVPGCIANMSRSFTGTLSDPVISEEGRQFLAGLLAQLSDKQIRDLFETARVTLRLRNPEEPTSVPGTIDEWVETFKAKREEIASRRCT
jgi:hypothetical protein